MALKRDWLRKEPPANETGSDLFFELKSLRDAVKPWYYMRKYEKETIIHATIKTVPFSLIHFL